jgi:hypothetical protein
MSRRYNIEVSMRGKVVAEYTVEATDALSAIDKVEAYYGPPPEIEIKTVHHESGVKENLLVVSDWHGYCFLAREVKQGTVR